MDMLSNSVVKAYLFYGTVVLAKTMIMSFITSLARFKKKVFANPEEVNAFGGKVKFDDVDVERVRRCHLNDMENVYLFALLGAFYCAIGPSYTVAVWHFRIFALSRITHTIVYLKEVPQPARGVAFFVGISVCISMIINIILATFSPLFSVLSFAISAHI